MQYVPRQFLQAAYYVAFVVLTGLCGVDVNAQETPAARYQSVAQDWLRTALPAVQAAEKAPLRIEVSVGNLDSRLKLAACGHVEPYLPVGMRLWGRAQVGLRCVDGVSRWNVMLPVTVHAYGDAWVIKNHVPAGAVVTAADVVQAEVNWAEDTNPVLKDRDMWEGQVATRALTTGQTVRQGMVRAAQVFQSGAPVRVVAQGVGFQVSSDAQAMSAGVVGQMARVRMDGGRVAIGVVLDGKTVQIDL